MKIFNALDVDHVRLIRFYSGSLLTHSAGSTPLDLCGIFIDADVTTFDIVSKLKQFYIDYYLK